jgi:magnesium chelatase family protein
LPSFTLVGLADTEVKESRERVRAALTQSGFPFPHNKRITVNLVASRNRSCRELPTMRNLP